jgi:hypothetical protein
LAAVDAAGATLRAGVGACAGIGQEAKHDCENASTPFGARQSGATGTLPVEPPKAIFNLTGTKGAA